MDTSWSKLTKDGVPFETPEVSLKARIDEAVQPLQQVLQQWTWYAAKKASTASQDISSIVLKETRAPGVMMLTLNRPDQYNPLSEEMDIILRFLLCG